MSVFVIALLIAVALVYLTKRANTKKDYKSETSFIEGLSHMLMSAKDAGIVILIAVCAIIVVCSLANYILGIGTGIFLVIFCVTFVVAVECLIAKEVEFIAAEKGYYGRKYFWYTFFLGIVGIALVIALPDKSKN